MATGERVALEGPSQRFSMHFSEVGKAFLKDSWNQEKKWVKLEKPVYSNTEGRSYVVVSGKTFWIEEYEQLVEPRVPRFEDVVLRADRFIVPIQGCQFFWYVKHVQAWP